MAYELFNYRGVELFADEEFIRTPPCERLQVCNGIGPAWMDPILVVIQIITGFNFQWIRWVLNHNRGLDCTIIGYIHDWDYHYLPNTEADKNKADALFRSNFRAWINAKSKSEILRRLRLRRVAKYNYLLAKWGDKAFYSRG